MCIKNIKYKMNEDFVAVWSCFAITFPILARAFGFKLD